MLSVGGTDLFINVGEVSASDLVPESRAQSPRDEDHDENFASV